MYVCGGEGDQPPVCVCLGKVVDYFVCRHFHL